MKKYLFCLLIILGITSCEDFLEEEVFTEYEPGAFLKDKPAVDALLTGAYSNMQISSSGASMQYYFFVLNELTTDITLESDGGFERQVLPFMQFTWDASDGIFNGQYNKFYRAVAAANNVLAVSSNLETIDEETLTQITAEARFVRGFSYYILHNIFGPTPIIEIPVGASLDEIEKIGKETPRPSEEEYRAYVEADFLFAANNLSEGGFSSRANKGNSYAMLTKFYLNNKQWQKAADAAQMVLGMGYELYDDYAKLFSVNGDDNNEYILRFESLVGSNQFNPYMPYAFPPNYPTLPNWSNYGAQLRTFTDFYETFEEQDVRRSLFLTEYTPTNTGVLTPLVRDSEGNALNNARSFKYAPDPDAVGIEHGNDIPYVRLADIILARAEALNELNGPNQESIDLINQIRERASASIIDLGDFPSKESLNDFILAERAKEFYTEGLRREDLIRHGKFIQQAIDRGIQAQPHQVVYPLPQSQLDNNPNLKQNPGYN
ncbi:RagB/SusD family nutrient uptake outer membrane protein [Arenibacter sp. M-2]|uniref:RagB/SusD family nutrient uptake outer membrane protein n=1 Tax=Arenibacter sp. M-2 TaxID=3053612 RepID=UPI00256FAC8E|nr:RagB/SusD family nutrient uptake outer membrane protein [Arenibacter sp. M-2]MDL5512288.1 RagB/SusD family nutrient uptake outer membrane protein [Arenibacter sp. M-2]